MRILSSSVETPLVFENLKLSENRPVQAGQPINGGKKTKARITGLLVSSPDLKNPEVMEKIDIVFTKIPGSVCYDDQNVLKVGCVIFISDTYDYLSTLICIYFSINVASMFNFLCKF